MYRFFLLILFFVSPLFARGGNFSGYYVGASGGMGTQFTKLAVDRSISYPGFFGFPETWSLEAPGLGLCSTSGFGSLFAGWGKQAMGCFYYGVRGGVNFTSFEGKTKLDESMSNPLGTQIIRNVLSKIQSELRVAEYTFDCKPGIVCKNYLLFGILGAAFNKLHLEGKDLLVVEFLEEPATRSEGLFLRKNSTKVGFRAGLGLECLLSSCISIYASYVYTYFDATDAQDTGTAPVAISQEPLEGGYNVAIRSDTKRYVSSLGLAFYF